jgi:hypothetical protein
MIDQCLRHPFAPVPDDDHDPLGRQFGQRVEDVQDHGATAQAVQRLRTRRAHPGPLAGGEDNGRKRPHLHAV